MRLERRVVAMRRASPSGPGTDPFAATAFNEVEEEDGIQLLRGRKTTAKLGVALLRASMALVQTAGEFAEAGRGNSGAEANNAEGEEEEGDDTRKAKRKTLVQRVLSLGAKGRSQVIMAKRASSSGGGSGTPPPGAAGAASDGLYPGMDGGAASDNPLFGR